MTIAISLPEKHLNPVPGASIRFQDEELGVISAMDGPTRQAEVTILQSEYEETLREMFDCAEPVVQAVPSRMPVIDLQPDQDGGSGDDAADSEDPDGDSDPGE